MPTLYKYMSFSTAKIVLNNQTLRWTTPATLNDPYDIQFDLKVDFDRDIVKRDAIEKIWKAYKGEYICVEGNKMRSVIQLFREQLPGIPKAFFVEKMSAGIEESFKVLDKGVGDLNIFVRSALSTSKILCLTDSPTNQLMWAYYADSNKGAVFQFEQEQGADSPYSTAKPVIYRSEIPSLFSENELSDFLAGLTVFDQQAKIDALIYTKSEAWAHEREWRIYSGDGRDKFAPHEDIRFGNKELTAVILGCRMPEADREALAMIVKERFPHAKILQANTINHKYQLEMQPTNY
ncbi:DUF2971 domain-containing protein [Pseudomonas sp. P155]|uniref:DUF2971 domain-containing protein n=1 Tax=Pseudomonas neuropathica TaxID=2730425 RepID=A0ABS0BQV4_9PSED|nr:DUF2971 domain-containing protein [Pseudomonas neuropathica]MBF6036821.1 DUF2971 domain-containing protein [Pseudomonas neuropathica]